MHRRGRRRVPGVAVDPRLARARLRGPRHGSDPRVRGEGHAGDRRRRRARQCRAQERPGRMARAHRQDPGRGGVEERTMPRAALQASGSADALWLARESGERPPLLIVTAAAHDAERLREEIAWFAPKLRVHRLPDWEILPYDQFSPHPDLVSERLSTLW